MKKLFIFNLLYVKSCVGIVFCENQKAILLVKFLVGLLFSLPSFAFCSGREAIIEDLRDNLLEDFNYEAEISKEVEEKEKFCQKNGGHNLLNPMFYRRQFPLPSFMCSKTEIEKIAREKDGITVSHRLEGGYDLPEIPVNAGGRTRHVTLEEWYSSTDLEKSSFNNDC